MMHRHLHALAALVVTCLGCSDAPMPTASASAPEQAPAASTPIAASPMTMPAAVSGSAPLAPAAAAGASAPPPASAPAPAAPAANSGNASAPSATAWEPLIQGAWKLDAGEEGYRCARLTIAEDLYLKEFQPIAPPGTHHTLLSVDDMPTKADGISTCSAADTGHTTLLGSGAGEHYSAGELPKGVAYKVAKGTQLNLNLHLFNVGDTPLEGTSGVKVRKTSADQVEQYAEVILAGTIALSIPHGSSTSSGTCTLQHDTTVFAVSPHMHQLGTHLKATAQRASGESVMLYDGAYDFFEQRQYAAGPLQLKAGDKVHVDCTYDNQSDRTVSFGESSLDEMCFVGVYRYPVAGESLVCVK